MKVVALNESPQLVCCKTVSPEDLAVGDFIAITRSLIESPSFLWCCDATLQKREDLVRLWLMPTDIQPPLKVCAVCLPFVLTKSVDRRSRLVDLRKVQIVRVDPKFGRRVRKQYRKLKS